jgi:hypothetical protein
MSSSPIQSIYDAFAGSNLMVITHTSRKLLILSANLTSLLHLVADMRGEGQRL